MKALRTRAGGCDWGSHGNPCRSVRAALATPMRLLSFILLIGCAQAQLLPDLAPDVPDAKPVNALPTQREASGLGPVAD